MTNKILKASIDDDLEVLDVSPEHVLAGEPRPRAKMLLHAGDMTRGVSGIFAAEPGQLHSPQARPETFHVLEGRARVQADSGEDVVLEAGMIAVLPAGGWRWTFDSPFRAVFVAGPIPAADAGA